MDEVAGDIFGGIPFAAFAEEAHEFDVLADFATSDLADLRLARMYKEAVEAHVREEKAQVSGEG